MPTMLVPIDVGGCAWEVVATASDLARRLECEVVLVGVVDTPSGVERGDPVRLASGREQRAHDALIHDEYSLMEPFKQPFVDAGVPVHCEVWTGRPVDTILAAASAHGSMHIVMGTHGRRGVARWVLGSVSEGVIRHACCPVTVIRTLAPEAHTGPSPLQQQLAAEADG